MLLRPDLPPLDDREIARPWLTPEEVLDVALMWTAARSPARKFFSNIVARGFVSGVPSGPGLTAPRLYSLESATKAAVMWRLGLRGRTYEVGAAVGETTVALLRHLVHDLPTSAEIDTKERQFSIVYTVTASGLLDSSGQGSGARAQWTSEPVLRVEDLQDIDGTEVGILHASPLLTKIIERYADRLLAAKERQEGAS